MKLLRFGDSGQEVTTLQELLIKFGYDVSADGIFGLQTEKAVRDFQRNNGLSSDGIVGNSTWNRLQDSDAADLMSILLKEEDFVRAADTLNVEVATVKAVKDVETGGRGGFDKINSPKILFEGHIFWHQLKKNGVNPENFTKNNEDILYPKWTKSHYLGGIREYERLSRAIAINKTAALSSASWGLFQIMGFNYKSCGFDSVEEYVNKMKENEGAHLDAFVAFIKNNKLDSYLRERDWAGFARRYNGPAYQENKYDVKLEIAYKKHNLV